MATKPSAAVDDEGMPYSLYVVHACKPLGHMRLLQPTLAAATVCIPRGTPLYANKGYDSAANCRHGDSNPLFRRAATKTPPSSSAAFK